MRGARLVVVAGAAIIAAGGMFYVLAPSTGKVAAEQVDASPVDGSGPLDGLTFAGALGPDGEPKDVPDTFVFKNGTFVSKECELRCQYPPRPYFVRRKDGKTEFISETRCPYKDARIVWRGSVEGSRIAGVATWTMKRWYWTIERRFAFEGTLKGAGAPLASTAD